MRAAILDATLYDTVKNDNTATIQAFKAVLVASIATGLGWGVSIVIEDGFAWLTWGLLLGIVLAISTWVLWSFITYIIGTRVFRKHDTAATYRELLRTTGFANSPATIGVFIFIPFVGWLMIPITFIWTLVAGVIAVRQTLAFSTWRAVGTYLVGWIIYVLVIVTPALVLFTIGKLA